MKEKYSSMCKECGKSSNVGNVCLYEDKEKMSHCPTFIRNKKDKGKSKKGV
jgi:hypothetical protein